MLSETGQVHTNRLVQPAGDQIEGTNVLRASIGLAGVCTPLLYVGDNKICMLYFVFESSQYAMTRMTWIGKGATTPSL